LEKNKNLNLGCITHDYIALICLLLDYIIPAPALSLPKAPDIAFDWTTASLILSLNEATDVVLNFVTPALALSLPEAPTLALKIPTVGPVLSLPEDLAAASHPKPSVLDTPEPKLKFANPAPALSLPEFPKLAFTFNLPTLFNVPTAPTSKPCTAPTPSLPTDPTSNTLADSDPLPRPSTDQEDSDLDPRYSTSSPSPSSPFPKLRCPSFPKSSEILLFMIPEVIALAKLLLVISFMVYEVIIDILTTLPVSCSKLPLRLQIFENLRSGLGFIGSHLLLPLMILSSVNPRFRVLLGCQPTSQLLQLICMPKTQILLCFGS
jgi:hypothetical protein